MKKKYLIILLLNLVISGCSTHLGPQTVTADRFDYNTAIANSWKEQTLLNIVKIRYADMPFFVEVASLVSGYTVETSFNAGGVFSSRSVTGDVLSLGGSAKYIDRPTITYVPITGAKFSKSFMTPIPPRAILYLMMSGWAADLVLKLAVEAINGYRSEISAGANQRTGDEEYYRMVELFHKIQKSGAIAMRIHREKSTPEKTVMLLQRKHVSLDIKAAEEELNNLLEVRPESQEIDVTYGLMSKSDTEIAMLTRSMLNIMLDLATKIDVPPEHVEKGSTVPSFDQSKGQLMTVRASKEKPENAFVAVEYKDHWFWIEDEDFLSKRTFAFVMILFSLTETGERGNLPIVTIPSG
ncbi:MAG: hypothetical protein KAI44_01940 [Methylococcales bacterium]|nr:hypothetical protein [Methylococcales bacterium]